VVAVLAVLAWPASFAAAADRHVGMGDVTFEPKTITVVPGDRVVWTNNSTRAHTVTADDGRFNQPVPPGGTFAFTFAQAGSVPYHCEIHAGAGMTGTVNVQGQAATTTTTAAPPATTTTTTARTATTTTSTARATTTVPATTSTTVADTTTSSSTSSSTTSTTELAAAPEDDGDGDEGGGGVPVALLVLALLAALGAGGYGLWRLWPRPAGPGGPPGQPSAS